MFLLFPAVSVRVFPFLLVPAWSIISPTLWKYQLTKLVVADIQARQCPDDGNTIISTKVGSGLSLYLLVVPDGISESSHARSIIVSIARLIDATEHILADIQRRQRPDGSMRY